MKSTNVVADIGIEIGNNIEENSYVKLKIGKGAEEVMALKQIVEAGIGQKLDDSQHSLLLWLPNEYDTDALTEMVEGEGNLKTNVIQGGEGKWVVTNLAECEYIGKVPNLEGEINNFFTKVNSNAYFELSIRSGKTFYDAKARAVETGEKNADGYTDKEGHLDTFASPLVFLENASANLKCDIDHNFLVDLMQLLKDKGAALIKPQFFDVVKKLNHMEFFVQFNSIEEAKGDIRKKIVEDMWNDFIPMVKEMMEPAKMFSGLLNKAKLYFILRDNAFVYLDLNLPGFTDYVNHMTEEEE